MARRAAQGHREVLAALLERLEAEGKVRSRGPISFTVLDPERGCRYQLSAGRDYPVNPQIKGAIRSLRGVAMVEEV